MRVARGRARWGFTMVELLLVIITVGIISIVALPKFLNFSHEGKLAASGQYVASMKSAIVNSLLKSMTVCHRNSDEKPPLSVVTSNNLLTDDYCTADQIPRVDDRRLLDSNLTAPVNPLTNLNTIVAVTCSDICNCDGGPAGYYYDYQTGVFGYPGIGECAARTIASSGSSASGGGSSSSASGESSSASSTSSDGSSSSSVSSGCGSPYSIGALSLCYDSCDQVTNDTNCVDSSSSSSVYSSYDIYHWNDLTDQCGIEYCTVDELGSHCFYSGDGSATPEQCCNDGAVADACAFIHSSSSSSSSDAGDCVAAGPGYSNQGGAISTCYGDSSCTVLMGNEGDINCTGECTGQYFSANNPCAWIDNPAWAAGVISARCCTVSTSSDSSSSISSEVVGCMDSSYDNYDPSATVDSGCNCNSPRVRGLDSCQDPGVNGCTTPGYDNYNPSATSDDGSCACTGGGTWNGSGCQYQTYGCTNPSASNYNPSANADDGSCTYSVGGCTDPTALNYNLSATYDDGSCTYSISGCTNPSASNYNPSANSDDGSCTYPVDGCTDPSAANYNPSATNNDGSCSYSVNGCTDPSATNYNPYANNNDGSCTYAVSGCTDPSATNYNPSATSNDGSCTYNVSGCTDPGATNYNPSANSNDGSCTYPVYGCTDPSASNYNPSATINDGSCTTYEVSGCTDPGASNYNPSATINDGSCTY